MRKETWLDLARKINRDVKASPNIRDTITLVAAVLDVHEKLGYRRGK